MYSLENKNILIICHEGILGGAERHALGLASFLSNSRNCKIDLLLTFSPHISDDFKIEAVNGIRNIYHFGTPYIFFSTEFKYRNLRRLWWSLKYLWKVQKGLRHQKYDIIIPFLNFPSKVAFYLYKILPSVQITFWHQLGLDVWKDDLLERIAVRKMPFIIGNADNCLDKFYEDYEIPRDKLNVIAQSLALEKIIYDKDQIRKNLNIPNDKIIVGMIAHYRPEKLHNLMIASFLKANKLNNLHLILLGESENSATTRSKFRDLTHFVDINCVSDNISLLSGNSVQEILSCLDMAVLVSDIEGTSNAVMEYMAYGLPVIATNHPGTISLLGDSTFLINNNQKELTDKIIELSNSNELRRSEGKRNLEAIFKYTPERYVQELEKVIDKYI